MDEASISVIIPVYNAEDHIERAYDCLKRQTVSLPMEIVFVDNNSSDSSLEILQKISEKDNRVKIFQEEKQGVASARNRGFKESKGDFIYFFDADDEMFDDSLHVLSDVLLNDDSLAASFGKMYKTDKCLEEININNLEETGEVVIKPQPFWGLKWLKDLSSVVGSATFLYRREVFEELGMYDERLKWNEDTALDILLGMDYKIAHIDKYIYLYIKHGQSLTDGLKKKMNRAYLQWPRYVLSHIPYAVKNPHQTEFNVFVRKAVFHLIGKMIFYAPSFKQRKKIIKEAKVEIRPWKLPFVINFYLNILVYFPKPYPSKFYHYYYLKLV